MSLKQSNLDNCFNYILFYFKTFICSCIAGEKVTYNVTEGETIKGSFCPEFDRDDFTANLTVNNNNFYFYLFKNNRNNISWVCMQST